MSLESIENTYGSVAEYNRSLDEMEYGDHNTVIPDFNKFYYECAEKKIAALENQIKELTEISDSMRYDYDNTLMSYPYMPDDAYTNMDSDYTFNSGRIDRLIDSAQKELSSTINSFVRSTVVNDRIWAAHQQYMLETLVSDPNPAVRTAVAEEGYGHDRLINDASTSVRRAVADITRDESLLAICASDDDVIVRRAALKSTNPEMLSQLTKDIDPYIRQSAQKQLEELSHFNTTLEKEVLDAVGFIYSSEKPYQAVNNVLFVGSNTYNIYTIEPANEFDNDDCYSAAIEDKVPLLTYDDIPAYERFLYDCRDKLNLNGMIIDTPLNRRAVEIFVNDYVIDKNELFGGPIFAKPLARKDDNFQNNVLSDIASDNPNDRKRAADNGYGLAKLVRDPDPDVRCSVARCGYGQNILINDTNDGVLCTLAIYGDDETRYKLSLLNNPEVNEVLQEQGYVSVIDKIIMTAEQQGWSAALHFPDNMLPNAALDFVHNETNYYFQVSLVNTSSPCRGLYTKDYNGDLTQAFINYANYQIGLCRDTDTVVWQMLTDIHSELKSLENGNADVRDAVDNLASSIQIAYETKFQNLEVYTPAKDADKADKKIVKNDVIEKD